MKKVFGIFLVSLGLTVSSITAASAARLIAHIDISSQTMTVKKDGKIMHRWKVSTAKAGKRTPTGTYSPQWLNKNHYSSLYNNAPMPYSIFFHGNYAIHGTTAVKSLGRPASHGCVRLATENARLLFNMTQQYGKKNLRVVITK